MQSKDPTYRLAYRTILTNDLVLNYKDLDGKEYFYGNAYGDAWAIMVRFTMQKDGNDKLDCLFRFNIESEPFLIETITQEKISNFVAVARKYANDNIAKITEFPVTKIPGYIKLNFPLNTEGIKNAD